MTIYYSAVSEVCDIVLSTYVWTQAIKKPCQEMRFLRGHYKGISIGNNHCTNLCAIHVTGNPESYTPVSSFKKIEGSKTLYPQCTFLLQNPSQGRGTMRTACSKNSRYVYYILHIIYNRYIILRCPGSLSPMLGMRGS